MLWTVLFIWLSKRKFPTTPHVSLSSLILLSICTISIWLVSLTRYARCHKCRHSSSCVVKGRVDLSHITWPTLKKTSMRQQAWCLSGNRFYKKTLLSNRLTNCAFWTWWWGQNLSNRSFKAIWLNQRSIRSNLSLDKTCQDWVMHEASSLLKSRFQTLWSSCTWTWLPTSTSKCGQNSANSAVPTSNLSLKEW